VTRDSILHCVTISDIVRLAGYPPPKDPHRLIRCSLHDDTTPSFRVFERGFRCFGCGKRGGLLDLIVELGKL